MLSMNGLNRLRRVAMTTAKCDRCGAEIHFRGGGYFCHNVWVDGVFTTQRWCIPCHREANDASSVSGRLAVASEVAPVDDAACVVEGVAGVRAAWMERLL
jgi:hypothetical protein